MTTKTDVTWAHQRHVLLVVSGTTRNNERLHVLEFHNAGAASAAKTFLEGFSNKFAIKAINDSV